MCAPVWLHINLRPTPRTLRKAIMRRISGMTRFPAPASISAGWISSRFRSTRSAMEYHDKTLPGNQAKGSHFCSMWAELLLDAHFPRHPRIRKERESFKK